jgi:protein gp37
LGKTKIEWTEYSWNPVSGCTPISEGCQNCYAKRMANRLRGRCGYPADEPFKVTLHKDRLEEPLRLKKPRRVFVCSMGDLFHEDVPGWMRFEVMDIILQAKQHTFLILTKRPANMKEFFEWYYSKTGRTIETIKNLWLGVTAENQQRADERIPILLQIPAAVRFIWR